MFAQVVPITRLRRATSWWTYSLPPNQPCQVGAIVLIEFHGRTVPGVVWKLEPDSEVKKVKPIIDVVFARPLVRNGHRQFIEWLSEYGLVSLSTSLFQWLPAALRKWPYSPTTRKLLSGYALNDITNEQLAKCHQHVIVTPYIPERLIGQLQKKFGNAFVCLFNQDNPHLELKDWLRISFGEVKLILGRERAVFFPWLNVNNFTILDPEDVSYYHDQAPYLNLTEAVLFLQNISHATLNIRGELPKVVLADLYPTSKVANIRPSLVRVAEITDLNKEKLLNEHLVAQIRAAINTQKNVFILYNAHDRDRLIQRDGISEIVRLPGVESISRQLLHLLGLTAQPCNLIIGTRSVFFLDFPKPDLAIALNIDHLLDQIVFANQLQGTSDIYHLLSFGCPLIIQTRQAEHPLITALQHGLTSEYLLDIINKQKQTNLPPFCENIVCSYPAKNENSQNIVEDVFGKITPKLDNDWQISHPFLAKWRRNEFWHLLISAPKGSRLNSRVVTELCQLPSPWRVQRNPWYIL